MTYDYLLTLLQKVKTDLDEAQRVADELVRDKMLTGECRLLGEQKAAIVYTELLVRERAKVKATLARRE